MPLGQSQAFSLSERILTTVPRMFDAEEIFCAGDAIGPNSACHGDSGGPVFKYVDSSASNPYYQLVANLLYILLNFFSH